MSSHFQGPLRANLGHTLRCAKRLDLNRTLPHNDLASSHYCLVEPGVAYLVYVPDDGQVIVDLGAAAGSLAVEWFSPRTGKCVQDTPVMGGRQHRFISPFGMDVALFSLRAGRLVYGRLSMAEANG